VYNKNTTPGLPDRKFARSLPPIRPITGWEIDPASSGDRSRSRSMKTGPSSPSQDVTE
jgi:hypothetical protein